jgi:hypothetical protein
MRKRAPFAKVTAGWGAGPETQQAILALLAQAAPAVCAIGALIVTMNDEWTSGRGSLSVARRTSSGWQRSLPRDVELDHDASSHTWRAHTQDARWLHRIANACGDDDVFVLSLTDCCSCVRRMPPPCTPSEQESHANALVVHPS